MDILKRILDSFVFWGAWILIPMLMEVVPALGSFFLLFRRRFRRPKAIVTDMFYPDLTIIIPVYNSEETLYACVKSIHDSEYPSEKIQVYLVNNRCKDNSFKVYAQCQEDFPNLHLTWMNSEQGKSRALNLALYNSQGKYIINIDSDGVLEPRALKNMIAKFEVDPQLNCMTGAILTTPDMINEHKSFWGRLLRNLEFVEYAQAFLAGRSYASEINAVYTLSGAFSAFRKSAILKSRMYNTDTVCEDTQLTFQMREIYKERVEVCEDALFLVDPIENVNRLYTQRQRWQRGSLEVAKQFCGEDYHLRQAFSNVNVKTLLYDHTFAFPRMIWYLALLCLLFMNYSGKVILYSTGMIFLMYIVIGYVYFGVANHYLKNTPELSKHYRRHWYCILLLPFFNFCVFFIRIAGIINSIGTDSAWRGKTLTEEKGEFFGVVKKDVSRWEGGYQKANGWMNAGQEKQQKPLGTIGLVVSVICIVLASVVFFVSAWVNKTYQVSLAEILTTLQGNINGTGSDVVLAVIWGCVVPVLVVAGLTIALVIWVRKGKSHQRLRRATKGALVTTGVLLPVMALLYANYCFDLIGYYKMQQSQSKIYANYYVDPKTVNITAEGQTKNLIYLYLESMETTYADTAHGGVQAQNYIPGLTELTKQHLAFAGNGSMSGLHTLSGFGYTISALFGTESGLPYKTIIDEKNAYAQVTTLGDILQEKGYTQEFLCGSDAAFGGRDIFFKEHGNYDIFDLFTAREKNYISEDYYEWWGFEDRKLFSMAKDELTRLAAEEAPFNFTFLTVDTHHIAGYVCEECGHEYDVNTANVVACTDRLVSEFIAWCQEQDFYQDTVIVIVGDHPRMDTYLVDGVNYYDRTEYNCFLNAAGEAELADDRIFTTFDMFPTTLAAMGFTVEGDRLGLGVNLFSGQKTLCEEEGFYWLEAEANKASDDYNRRFVD